MCGDGSRVQDVTSRCISVFQVQGVGDRRQEARVGEGLSPLVRITPDVLLLDTF